ncbi:MAG: hypothetical protein WC162_12145 [Sphaerochaetaceae bacterium]
MRVGILLGGVQARSKDLEKIAKALARGLEKNKTPALVETFDMYQEMNKICSYYDYIIIGSESLTFFGGKIPSVVSQFLGNAGSLSGKRCLAFISKKGMRKVKTLQVLMKAMESEGMYIKNSDIISNENLAFVLGKRLVLEQ